MRKELYTGSLEKSCLLHSLIPLLFKLEEIKYTFQKERSWSEIQAWFNTN